MSPLVMAVVASLICISNVMASPVEVVVSHFDENLSWLSQLASPVTAESPRISIYTKGPADLIQPDSHIKIQSLPNVGRESHTYLSHIVTNYDRLADWTIFTQAGEPSFGYKGHREGGGHLMAGDSFANYLIPNPTGARFMYTAVVQLPSMNHLLRASFCINDTRVEGGNLAACPKEASQWTAWWDIGPFHDLIAAKIEMQGGESAMDFYRKYINPRHVGKEVTVSFPQGARFAVSREKILSRPKADYERLLETLSHDIDPYSGYFMEWMWSELFLGHQEPCPLPPRSTAISHPMALDELAERYPVEVKSHLAKMGTTQAALRRVAGVSGGVSGGVSSGISSGVSGGDSGTTTTTTNGRGPSAANSTTTAAMVQVQTISGSMALTVPNCTAFIAQAGIVAVFAQAIGSVSGVDTSMVAATLTCPGGGRRLADDGVLNALLRRLADAMNANYVITIPSGSSVQATTVSAAMTNQTATSLTTALTMALTAAGLPANVTVTSVTPPTLGTAMVPAASLSTTTAATTTMSTTIMAAKGKSSARQQASLTLALVMALAMMALA